MKVSVKRYFWIFVLMFALSAVAFATVKRPDIVPWIGGCNASGYDDEHYLAYCNHRRFGDFEHYAVMHDVIPGQLDNIAAADVLFLGNSRAQYGFSTDAVENFLESRGIRHFLLGFGMGAKATVPREMFLKYELNPKVLVINVDPFFSDSGNLTVEKVIRNRPSAGWEYGVKKSLQDLQRSVCSNQAGFLLDGLLCSGTNETVYRSSINGSWATEFYRDDKQFAVTYDGQERTELAESTRVAEEFLALVGLPRSCVILTVTPRTNTDNDFAYALAAATDLPIVIPVLDNLTTIDNSHLSEQSAERWSMEVLRLAESRIEDCLSAA